MLRKPPRVKGLRFTALGVAGAMSALLAVFPTTGRAAQGLTSGNTLLDMIKPQNNADAKMLVEADSLTYDLDKNIVSADGKVVVYYGDYVLVADRVTVNRATKRVMATGDVTIKDPSGNVIHGASVDVTDDLREGVAEALELITNDRVAFRARKVTRSDGGDKTVMEDGHYLPCVDCNGVKGREPIWQIKANRIIHKSKDQEVVFENATFEFLGVPLAWVPSISQPDPSVKNKTGLLTPGAGYNSARGFSVKVPYYIAAGQDTGLTLSPSYFTRQGMLFDGEWRQRLESGSYKVELSGIRQIDPEAYAGTPGDRRWRGSVISEGRFRINDRWNWGWNFALASDATFMKNYGLTDSNNDVAVNNVFLTGVDGRNRFELNAYGFFVEQTESTTTPLLTQDRDLQSKQPVVHPSVDYQVFSPDPVYGGEFSLTSNFTSLTRIKSDKFEYDSNGDGKIDGTDTPRLRGAAGTFDRLSLDALWRRRFVDNVGETFTPFLYFRGDAIFSDPSSGSALPTQSNKAMVRGMPAVGLEYSYPIGITSPVGTHIIEPVAQLIVRPNEQEASFVPNDDAQSLVFDANSLFDYDKFSGYDRVEGGTRANLGLRYSGSFSQGINLTGVVGQSIQLAGENSFAIATAYNTGLYSGLENKYSDYVADMTIATDMGLSASAGVRLDRDTFAANRVTAQILAMSGPMTTALTYAFIRQQPDLGIDTDRSQLQLANSIRVTENWRLFGSVRYDLANNTFVRHAFGVAYDAEEFSLSLSYANDMTTSPSDRTIYLRAGFRTLGSTTLSAGLP